MNFEQVMIRLAVDATAVKSGLGKVGSLVKGWGTSIAQSLKGHFGAMIGAGAVIAGLNSIKNKILEISHAAEETGANTNFIQGMMQAAEKSGKSFEAMTGGIAKFNKQLGMAKMGDPKSLATMLSLGVATKESGMKTVTFTSAIHGLAVKFDSLNDKQKQAALLAQAFGRSYVELMPVFEQGAAAIDKMSQGNFFTKISEDSIRDFRTMYGGLKQEGATVVNSVGYLAHGWTLLSRWAGLLSTGVGSGDKRWAGMMQEMSSEEEKVTKEKQLQTLADQEGISVQEMKAKILAEQASLMEKQADLAAQINDRDKLSVDDMASRARRALHQKSPLEQMAHTVTPRQRIALDISNLEERAKAEFLMDHDEASYNLQSQADQIRASNTWMKRADINPMGKTEQSLDLVTKQLEPVKRMAEQVTNSK